ncbi:MAG: DedA family protein [Chloroflexi bacterium]|nr:DedA family protein [Chloroflexota bacterium]
MPFDLVALVEWAGYIGLFSIVFAETGLLVGFLLPGDSLLIAAGLLAQRGHFVLELLIPLLIVAAITGDATGYAIGRSAGPRLFAREDARFFRRRHLDRARVFYERHGGQTIVLARFMAIIRTFAPTIAGAAGMSYSRFTFYNVTGGIAWVGSMTLVGFYLGEAVPNLDAVLFLVVGAVIAASLAPAAWHLWRERRAARRVASDPARRR